MAAFDPRSAILAALLAAEAATEHARTHPLDHCRWTIAQRRYLESRRRRKMLRMGNRGGKSWVALADVAYRATKRHPFRPDWNARRGPQHQWIVTVSWSQQVPLQRLFRGFLSADDLVKAPNWDPAKGWGKDAPTLVFRDGSTVGWRTMRQGPLAHAGADLDHVLIDEPCAAEHYRELERRVLTRAGEISLSLTPVNAPGDLGWLRELADEGVVQDLHFKMTEDLFRYEDGSLRTLPDGTLCNQAWIEEQLKGVPMRWREIVIDGGWEEIAVDATFAEVFERAVHVSSDLPTGKVWIGIGFDHGSGDFCETAVLVAVDKSAEFPRVHIIDAIEQPANSPPEADAKAILAMLRRNGVAWKSGSLDWACGDIAHYGGRRNVVGRKSNAELAAELARSLQLGRYEALAPPIRTAKTGMGSTPRGSVFRGESWLHKALLRPGQLRIHPRAESVIKAFEKYRGGSEDPHGHLMDAVRYALDPWINKGQTRTVPPPTLVVR